jgi:3-hydroxybutyryl-CoA dehydrogenase
MPQTAQSGSRTVGIAGAGKMGTELAYFFSERGYSIVWLGKPDDPKEERRRRRFERRISRGGAAGATGMTDRYIGSDIARLRTCDILIEAISEDIHKKQAFYAAAAPHLPAGCLVVTNSSSIPPSLLSASESPCHGGMHFFSPVAGTSLVELTFHEGTSGETQDRLRAFVDELGCLSLESSEDHAFPINRIMLDVQADAYRMSLEGLGGVGSIDLVDDVSMREIYGYGIFALIDLAGVDVVAAAAKRYVSMEEPEDAEFYRPLVGKLDELIAAGRLGTKSGGGFFASSEEISGESLGETPKAGSENLSSRNREIEEIRLRLQAVYVNAYRRHASHYRPRELHRALKIFSGLHRGPEDSIVTVGEDRIDGTLRDLHREYGYSRYVPFAISSANH